MDIKVDANLVIAITVVISCTVIAITIIKIKIGGNGKKGG